MEPLSHHPKMELRFSNANGKIWIFTDKESTFVIDDDTEQPLHGRILIPRIGKEIAISAIYAKCSRSERYGLWDKLREFAEHTERMPWMIGGEFNTILHPRDRVGSDTNRLPEMVDFAEMAEDCRLIHPGFDGFEYTWAKNTLLERLDRAFINENWTEMFEATRVTNLPRVASDHGPVLARCKLKSTAPKGSSFRFQNMWTRHPQFLALVQSDWEQTTEAGGLLNLQIKLSRLKHTVKSWNRYNFGNLHANL